MEIKDKVDAIATDFSSANRILSGICDCNVYAFIVGERCDNIPAQIP